MAKKTAETVLNEARKHIGYEGGYNKDNMFGKAYGMNNVDWCVIFVWYCFNYSGCGDLFLNGGKTAICSGMENFYKAQGRWYTSNFKVGDIVIYDFDHDGDNDHTGIIESVENGYIVAIEGNTSSANQASGNTVQRRTRYNSVIKGVCRPAYESGSGSTTPSKPSSPTKTEYTRTQFIKDCQKAFGIKVDGIAGNQTLNATVTLSTSKNTKHAVVKALQKRLNQLGYATLTVDGVYGAKTKQAVIKYQKQNKCVADGEITAKMNTWKNLLGLL